MKNGVKPKTNKMAEKGCGNKEKTRSDDAVPGRTEQILCQPCSSKDKQTVADVFCSTCDEFQCTECSNVHTTHAFLRSHKLVNAKEFKTIPVSFDMKGTDRCGQHKKTLKFFCEDANQLCCSTCAIVDHRKCHSVVEIQKIAERSASTSSKLKASLQDIREKAETVVKYTKSSKEQLNQDVKEVSLKIRKMRDNVMKMFDDLERSVAKDAESFKTETFDKLTKKQSDSEKHIADVTKSLETIDNVQQHGTPSQQFILAHIMNKRVDELSSNVDKECQRLETVTVSFDFDETLKLPPLSISDYVPGQLTLKYSVPEALKPITQVEPVVKLTKITSIDLKQTNEDIGEPLYTGLDFLPDGRLVAVDNRNKKCLIYNEKLEKVGSYSLSYIPQSVVAVSEEEVAITCGGYYKIDFLRVSKSNNITLIRTCKVKTQYASICLKDEGHFVVGIIDDTRPVRIVSLSGEEKNFSINFPDEEYPIGTSACTYIRNSDKVVLTDRYEHTVYIYDIKSNTRVVVKDDQIKEPWGVAVGPSDCILVCSNKTNSILKISQTGRVLSSYKLDMKLPYRVCVSEDKSLIAVSSNLKGGRKLQLLKVEY
ncbi:E3 ubiquitin-protein ligase TRIM9-like [Mercenaria mercenaria]|uniref:E3 ubiquitin-protein ligase TRIM9-like n=1 Tax=Mercenaria mercenaria TaxID=6596 RepID=UPI00234F42D2|nr:E3 ubiquitin-protein ligase TRIM9-like [Mercenaria mercenaria]